MRPAFRSACRPAAAAAALAVLAACGDDPIAPAASVPAAQFRRLLVADSGNFARTFNLETGARADSMGGLPGRITYLYTAMGRVAVAHFQTQNRIAFIDGGVYEQGGRGVAGPARIIGTLDDQTPIHGNTNGRMLSSFFDGTGNMRSWDEAQVAAGNLAPAFMVNTGAPHHGAAVTLSSDFKAASVRSVSGTSPDGVIVFNRQGQRVDSTRTCAGLHGLAATSAGAMFGCADGALFVAMNGGRAAFTKVTRPDNAAFGVGTVWSREGQSNFLVRMSIRGAPLSAATRAMGVADPATREMRAIAFPGDDIDWTAELTWSGAHAAVLGRTGTLYVVDMRTRQITGQLAGLVPPRPTSGTVLDPFLAPAAGLMYVSSPAQGRVLEVAISAAGVPSLARTMAVGGTPMRLAVMGVREDRRLQPAN